MINSCLSINNVNINSVYSKYTRDRLPFQKNSFDTVSFSSKNILNRGSKYITDTVIKTITNPSTVIGEGAEGVVYKIPDTDFCVKILNSAKLYDFGVWDLNISPKDRVNHIVAKSECGASIMKYIEGEALRVLRIPDSVYNLPKQSYKNLLKQISNAHNTGLSFDSTPSNIIYNPKDKSLTAIDFMNAKEFMFEPFSMVYRALKDYMSPKRDFNNEKLSNTLLNVAIDEIKNNYPSGISVSKPDMVSLLSDSKKCLSEESKLKWFELNELFNKK